jgi:hypothetical protein
MLSPPRPSRAGSFSGETALFSELVGREPRGLVLPEAARRRGGIIELCSRGARRCERWMPNEAAVPLEGRFGAALPHGGLAVAFWAECATPLI